MYMMCLYDAALTFDDRAWGRIGLFSTPLREGELSMRGTKCGVFVDLICFFFLFFSFVLLLESELGVISHQSSFISSNMTDHARLNGVLGRSGERRGK